MDWVQDKMAAIFHTFPNAFVWWKLGLFDHMLFFHKDSIQIIHHLDKGLSPVRRQAAIWSNNRPDTYISWLLIIKGTRHDGASHTTQLLVNTKVIYKEEPRSVGFEYCDRIIDDKSPMPSTMAGRQIWLDNILTSDDKINWIGESKFKDCWPNQYARVTYWKCEWIYKCCSLSPPE